MKVILLGDGILDSHTHLDNKKQDLKQELISLGCKVDNLAIDEIRVRDLHNGFKPSQVLIKSRSYPYNLDKEGMFYPMKSINTGFSSIFSNNDEMIVLSIGGNDVQANITGLVFGVNNFIKSLLNTEFVSDYEKIIEILQRNYKKIVLVSIFLPYLGPNSTYGKYSNMSKIVMDAWHEFLNKIANKYSLPVLDLSKTLNPQERSHYGTLDTRISNKSCKCIAQCIKYIYENYNPGTYYAPNCDFKHIKCE